MTNGLEKAKKLTKAQAGMLAACIDTGGAWTTAIGCENDALLSGWADRGWVRKVDPPAQFHSLASYVITPLGLTALQSLDTGGGDV